METTTTHIHAAGLCFDHDNNSNSRTEHGVLRKAIHFHQQASILSEYTYIQYTTRCDTSRRSDHHTLDWMGGRRKVSTGDRIAEGRQGRLVAGWMATWLDRQTDSGGGELSVSYYWN